MAHRSTGMFPRLYIFGTLDPVSLLAAVDFGSTTHSLETISSSNLVLDEPLAKYEQVRRGKAVCVPQKLSAERAFTTVELLPRIQTEQKSRIRTRRNMVCTPSSHCAHCSARRLQRSSWTNLDSHNRLEGAL
ncbi:hypothetical protein BR93DRAFT_285768 [Coniochaeta sp. PMI_546]|nr:hypothetical protein BR93DRAFT_285768 [Coniochaeta sp. PMI_546]